MIRKRSYPYMAWWLGPLALAWVGLLSPVFAAGSEAGKVLFSKGVFTAKDSAGEVRFLGKDTPLYSGDVLSTGPKSFALVEFSDGSRITLRPGTVFGVEEYDHGQGRENAVLRLFRGGLRALTGLIGKRNPDRGFRMRTPVATIGIRGTEFDARICAEDCAKETGGQPAVEAIMDSPVVGRVVFLVGQVRATDEQSKQRILLKGAPVYQGDLLETGATDMAMVAFRDDTRVTLRRNTRFRVEQYQVAGTEGNILFRLLKGGLRTLTGLVASRKPRSFQLATAIATIGIRGTGFDVSCEGACVGDGAATPPIGPDGRQCSPGAGGKGRAGGGGGLLVHTWKGTVEMRADACTLVVERGKTGFLAAAGAAPGLVTTPPFMLDDTAPRPDRIEVDTPALFSGSEQQDAQTGLYVSVYDGHVVLENPGGAVDLGRGEAGYVHVESEMPVRLAGQPVFQVRDRFPRPGEVDERMLRVLDLIFEDMGDPAQCEIR